MVFVHSLVGCRRFAAWLLFVGFPNLVYQMICFNILFVSPFTALIGLTVSSTGFTLHALEGLTLLFLLLLPCSRFMNFLKRCNNRLPDTLHWCTCQRRPPGTASRPAPWEPVPQRHSSPWPGSAARRAPRGRKGTGTSRRSRPGTWCHCGPNTAGPGSHRTLLGKPEDNDNNNKFSLTLVNWNLKKVFKLYKMAVNTHTRIIQKDFNLYFCFLYSRLFLLFHFTWHACPITFIFQFDPIQRYIHIKCFTEGNGSQLLVPTLNNGGCHKVDEH